MHGLLSDLWVASRIGYLRTAQRYVDYCRDPYAVTLGVRSLSLYTILGRP